MAQTADELYCSVEISDNGATVIAFCGESVDLKCLCITVETRNNIAHAFAAKCC